MNTFKTSWKHRMKKNQQSDTIIGIAGGGRVGKAIYHLLIDGNVCQDVYVADIKPRPDDIKEEHYVQTSNGFNEFVQGKTLIINALPYTENIKLFRTCYNFKIPYFDLSEDDQLDKMLKEQENHLELPFVMPHCGLAPGISTVIAKELSTEDTKDIKIRVGALSANATNKLRYHTSWSGEGLVNEYIGDCHVIHKGKLCTEQALTGYERITIDGTEYEAFNTSGGIGTLPLTLSSGADSIEATNVNYKTLRRVGHHDYADFLFNDLELSKDMLKDIFKNHVPKTTKDCVILYIQADEREYYKEFTPETIQGRKYTAIELTTAIGLISMVELYLKGKLWSEGYYRQEWVDWSDVMNTTYGWHYSQKKAGGPTDETDWNK